ncbi:hypothetical protein [Serinicoccus sp. LYQ131]|uniref:hypothetical protein n=1 Tax=Serinicoccus sp. LYQ131 TaxID=3378797 RepID=UPI0038546971
MTRFAIDAPVALRLARGGATLGAEHRLVGPGSLRSDLLSLLYGQVRSGELEERTALELLDRSASLTMRLLADRVSRRVAWRIATELGLPDTHLAEYVAVATLQGDVLVTDDSELTRAAGPYVRATGWTELATVLA